MLKVHRLVGWWLVGGLVTLSLPCVAQTTASFPEDAPAQPAPAAPAPPPPPPPVAPPAPAAATAHPVPAPAAVAPPPARPITPVAAPPPVTAAPGTAAVASSAGDARPAVLPHYRGYPVPPGYEVVKRPASGLIKGGLVGFGVAYAGAIGFAAASGFKNGTGWLAAPIIGPWGAIGGRNYEQCRTSTVAEAKRCVRNAVSEVQIITFLAVDGIGQLAGALIMLAGAMSTREELVRSDLVDVEVSVIPPSNGDPWALSVQGKF